MKRIFIFIFASLFTAGVFAQKTTELKPSELPKKITEYFTKNLGTYTIGRSAKSEEKGVVRYKVLAESNGKKAVYLFDQDGNIIVREKNKGKEQPKPVPPIAPSGKKTDDKAAPVKK